MFAALSIRPVTKVLPCYWPSTKGSLWAWSAEGVVTYCLYGRQESVPQWTISGLANACISIPLSALDRLHAGSIRFRRAAALWRLCHDRPTLSRKGASDLLCDFSPNLLASQPWLVLLLRRLSPSSLCFVSLFFLTSTLSFRASTPAKHHQFSRQYRTQVESSHIGTLYNHVS